MDQKQQFESILLQIKILRENCWLAMQIIKFIWTENKQTVQMNRSWCAEKVKEIERMNEKIFNDKNVRLPLSAKLR